MAKSKADTKKNKFLADIQQRMPRISEACRVEVVDDGIEGSKGTIVVHSKAKELEFTIVFPWRVAEWARGPVNQILRTHMKSLGGVCHLTTTMKGKEEWVRIDIIREGKVHSITMPWSVMSGLPILAAQTVRLNWA
jgi:hypothetical protein